MLSAPQRTAVRPARYRVWRAVLFYTVLFFVAGGWAAWRFMGPLPVAWGTPLDAPSPNAHWPWSSVASETLSPGVTHWRTPPASDGTIADLFRFDFVASPDLHFGIYDQDEDDAEPFDNAARNWNLGAAQVANHLTKIGRGTVIADWNGLFFASSTGAVSARTDSIAHHVGPVVLGGHAHNFGPEHRWMFGVSCSPSRSRPVFKALFQPDPKSLSHEFTDAADAAQCLVQNGKPLALRPLPAAGSPPERQPVPCTASEAGHITLVDHIKTTRASLGWSRDSRYLYLLFVKEPDSEGASIWALQHGIPLQGGWTVADLQRFWLSLGVWGAINSDAGSAGQLVYQRSDGRYDLIPPTWASRVLRLTLDPARDDAPHGGTLMYFYVVRTETKRE